MRKPHKENQHDCFFFFSFLLQLWKFFDHSLLNVKTYFLIITFKKIYRGEARKLSLSHEFKFAVNVNIHPKFPVETNFSPFIVEPVSHGQIYFLTSILEIVKCYIFSDWQIKAFFRDIIFLELNGLWMVKLSSFSWNYYINRHKFFTCALLFGSEQIKKRARVP